MHASLYFWRELCCVYCLLVFADFDQFYGMLVQHIYQVLLERDEVTLADKEWVINEAMNPTNLQHGGTFSNALSRKVDKVVTPIFSGIIAKIDQNFNLDLIDPNDPLAPLSQFWLNMFHDSAIMQFNYTDMVTPQEQYAGVGGRKAMKDFKCELPFSWLVFDAVDCQWHNVNNTGGMLPYNNVTMISLWRINLFAICTLL